MVWTYSQSTGKLTRNGKLIAAGYSGHGEGLNNPEKQNVRAVGPLPRGKWRMEGVYNSAQVGPFAIILVPMDGTETFGRYAFRVHGDNSKGDKSASNGCLIFPRAVRQDMWTFKDHQINVVE